MNDNRFGRLNDRIDRLRVAPLIAHTARAYTAHREAMNQAYRAGLIGPGHGRRAHPDTDPRAARDIASMSRRRNSGHLTATRSDTGRRSVTLTH
ncbi:hypothetical protein DK926_19455 [Rhodococcus sp. Eu-32]|uniref:hypothetical protein n=1 Tax=Rhodococcus sp. Eu-32 TaxID=1017319 RepID=UPI000DF374D1|nr:hypothetical protein [Rhodococcus sp. Eu-32]RRQ26177.1 hypothetical protein DK926_19455 [Rhodococcus sp. Eu-32]